MCPCDLRSLYLFKICADKSYLASACLSCAVASLLSNSASICPFFTTSPMSTLITLIFPGISKARFDCCAGNNFPGSSLVILYESVNLTSRISSAINSEQKIRLIKIKLSLLIIYLII